MVFSIAFRCIENELAFIGYKESVEKHSGLQRMEILITTGVARKKENTK